MYGLLLRSIQHYVQLEKSKTDDDNGLSVWERVLEIAGLHKDTFFYTHLQYPDQIMTNLALAVSKVLPERFPTIHDSMHYFGQCFVHFSHKFGYDKLFFKVGGRHYRDFLHGIDYIHENMRFSYPYMQSPLFLVEEEDPQGCYLVYMSARRGFAHYVRGQLEQCGLSMYDANVEVKVIEQWESDQGCHTKYRLNFNNTAYAPRDATPAKPTSSSCSFPPVPGYKLFEVFGFAIIFDKDMVVQRTGPGVPKLLGDRCSRGTVMTSLFSLRRPLVDFTWSSIFRHRNKVAFELEVEVTKTKTLKKRVSSRAPFTNFPVPSPSDKTTPHRPASSVTPTSTSPFNGKDFASALNMFCPFTRRSTTAVQPTDDALDVPSSCQRQTRDGTRSSHNRDTSSLGCPYSGANTNANHTQSACSAGKILERGTPNKTDTKTAGPAAVAQKLGSSENEEKREGRDSATTCEDHLVNGAAGSDVDPKDPKDEEQETEKNTVKLLLKGQMLYIPEWKCMAFISTPLISNLRELEELGMYLNDLNMYDNSRQMVMQGVISASRLESYMEQEVDTCKKIQKNIEALEKERKERFKFLRMMLPETVAKRLIGGEDPLDTCQTFEAVTILFSNLVGFEEVISSSNVMDIIPVVNHFFSIFDPIVDKHKLVKVETSGDAQYMVAGGVSGDTEDHAQHVAGLALDFLAEACKVICPLKGKTFTVRIGMHTGSVVSGSITKLRPQYCLFGDTVNTASRMQTSSLPGRIHLSEPCHQQLKKTDFVTVYRGMIKVKGKGELKSYWLAGRQGQASTQHNKLLFCKERDGHLTKVSVAAALN